MPKHPTHSSSPFYDLDFALTPKKRPPRKKKPMPISTRTVERWICDRCGRKDEFPNELGHMATEEEWLRLDLPRSLANWSTFVGKNEQILCPTCVDKLALWFQTCTSPTSTAYNEGEEARYDEVLRQRTYDGVDDSHFND